MKTLREPLIRRLLFFFFVFGFLPTLFLAAVPIGYIIVHGAESAEESLLWIWGAQGISFLVIVLVGASETFRRLALPIQGLVNAADILAKGNLSYRVPARSGERELSSVSRAFNEMADAIETMQDEIEQQRNTLQSALAERERAFAAILQVTSLINSGGDLSDLIARALKISHSAIRANTLSLILFDEAGQIASSVAVCSECSEGSQPCHDQCLRKRLLRRAFQAMHDDVFQDAIRRGEKISIQDIHGGDTGLKPETVEVLNSLGARKMSIIPLIAHKSALGMIVLMRPEMIEISIPTQLLVKALAENLTILIENYHLQSRSQALTILEERRHLARELHDSVTQSLFTLSLMARGLKASLVDVPGVEQPPLDVLVEQTRIVQLEMRKLINELRPVDLDAYELEERLQHHTENLRRSANTDVKLSIQGDIHRLPRPIQQNLNRIVQEALSNIARHADARLAEVRLAISDSDQVVTLTIWDNGKGFDPRAIVYNQAASLGLESMRERTEMLGGALMIRSQPGDATTITAKIPLAPERVGA